MRRTRPSARSLVEAIRGGIPLLLALLVVACDGDWGRSPTGPGRQATVPLELTLELHPDQPTFKVDGRLELVWEYAGQPVGGRDLGMAVLPADERREVVEIHVPAGSGRIVATEVTFSPTVPYLCGATRFLNSRETRSVTLTLELC